MSSLTSGLAQSHITPHVGSTPTKLQTSSASAPISILGSSSSMTGGSGGYGSMNIGYKYVSKIEITRKESCFKKSFFVKYLVILTAWPHLAHPSLLPHQQQLLQENIFQVVISTLHPAYPPPCITIINKHHHLFLTPLVQAQGVRCYPWLAQVCCLTSFVFHVFNDAQLGASTFLKITSSSYSDFFLHCFHNGIISSFSRFNKSHDTGQLNFKSWTSKPYPWSTTYFT